MDAHETRYAGFRNSSYLLWLAFIFFSASASLARDSANFCWSVIFGTPDAKKPAFLKRLVFSFYLTLPRHGRERACTRARSVA